MSDIEKKRAEFEAAFAQETARRAALEAEYDPDQIADLTVFVMVRDRRGDTYRQEHFASAWWAWQASRQTIVVEIPDFDEYPTSIGRDMQRSLRSVCEARGLRVGVRK